MKKRVLSILLAGALAVGSILGSSLSAGATAIPGDADGNGKVEANDVTLIQRHLSHMILLNEAAQKISDVDGNGTLDICDVTLIQRKLANMVDRLPVEKNGQGEVHKVKDIITIHFTDNKKWGKIYAYLYNKATGTPLTEYPGVEMTADGKDDKGNPIYKLDVDVSRYDRAIFNDGGSKQTTETPVSKASTGYTILNRSGKKYIATVNAFGECGEGRIDITELDYSVLPGVSKKTIQIWTPEGYDPEDTDKRYSVLYMTDAQNLFGNIPNMSGYYWECQDTVNSLMFNGGDGIIIVGIDSDSEHRFNELTPDLGELNPETMAQDFPRGVPEGLDLSLRGKGFSDFVANDVVSYVDSHYNTNSVRGIAGSSSGGIEAFFIGIDHMDTFDYIGAFSPAFLYFTEETWDTYLDTKDFSGDVPRIYFYCGNDWRDETEQQIYPEAIAMESWMIDHDYPADKMVTIIDDDARHHETYWALYFPELISWGLDL